MPHPLRASHPALLQSLALAIGLLTAASTQAQEGLRPYYIGASQTFTHDDNVRRTTTGQISDTISSTGLLAGIDVPISRQRLFANGSVQANRYKDRSELNNVSYSLTGGVDWETIEHLTGTLRYTAAQSLADIERVGVTEENLQRTQSLAASARWGAAARLAFEGGAEHRRVNYSTSAERNYSENLGRIGVKWGTPEQLVFGVGLRLTKGKFPNRLDGGTPPAPAPDETDRKDVDLTAAWVPTGLSTITARLSATRQTHSRSSIPRFSGATGQLSWLYRPTGRFGFTASLGRDTGTETTFIAAPAVDPATPGPTLPLQVDSNRVSNFYQLAATYELTGKTGLTASAVRRNGTLTSTSGTVPDATSSYLVGLRYAATRSISLGLNAGRESRDNSYVVNTVSLTGQITLR